MGIIHAILGETDFEVPTTVRVLERVPQDKLDWTPHPKSMTIGKLAWHVANIPARVQQMLRAGDFDLAASGPPDMPRDVKEFPATLQRNMDELREYLRTLDDDALKQPFTLRHGEQVLQKITKVAVLRSILLNHTYHHRGQLTVYLRMLDIPVPAVYGASADENPFG